MGTGTRTQMENKTKKLPKAFQIQGKAEIQNEVQHLLFMSSRNFPGEREDRTHQVETKRKPLVEKGKACGHPTEIQKTLRKQSLTKAHKSRKDKHQTFHQQQMLHGKGALASKFKEKDYET